MVLEIILGPKAGKRPGPGKEKLVIRERVGKDDRRIVLEESLSRDGSEGHLVLDAIRNAAREIVKGVQYTGTPPAYVSTRGGGR